MFSTYRPEDVTILLKDITGRVTPLDTKEREKRIQSNVHYSSMLPLEYRPSKSYLETYRHALKVHAGITAEAVATVAEKIWAQKGERAVLVSLARAGTPIGILIRRYLLYKYHRNVPHYTISIIRGIGIDKNAMDYILKRHAGENIQFVDGWTGKGAIHRELCEVLSDYPMLKTDLAVLSDPAHVAEKYGTLEDFLIPSSCLNATVSGLLSRTFLREDIIGKNDFHGAAFYREWMAEDLTYDFIETIEHEFPKTKVMWDEIHASGRTGLEEAEEIRRRFRVHDINLVKPSIGEATRVLLRRVPWKILVHRLDDEEHLGHLYQLAREKGVEVVEYPLCNYKACGIIRTLPDT